jgi:hypothetical protein
VPPGLKVNLCILAINSHYFPTQLLPIGLYYSLYLLTDMWHILGERRGAYRASVEKPEGRRPLGRPRRRWEDNIKMDLREVGCGGADWIDLAQDRDRWRVLVYTVMNLWVP